MALPPSLDLEIQAIRQVGSASMECSGGHQDRNSMCPYADPQSQRPGYLALGDSSSHTLLPEHHLLVICPPPACLLCLNPSPEKPPCGHVP